MAKKVQSKDTATNSTIRVASWSFILVLAMVLLIGMTSLFLSYQVAGSVQSESAVNSVFLWRYDQLSGTQPAGTGLIIEAARLVLGVFLAALCLLSGFRRELLAVFWVSAETERCSKQDRAEPKPHIDWNGLGIWLGRFVFALSAFIGVYIEGTRAFSFDADSYTSDALNWAWRNDVILENQLATEFSSTAEAYSIYMLYSAMFYGVIVPLVLSIPIAALPGDIARAIQGRQKVVHSRSAEQGLERLSKYGSMLTESASRYMDVLGGVATFHIYEVLLGNLTLSESAQSAVKTALLICCASLLSILLVWYYYFSAWQSATDYKGREVVLQEKCEAPAEFLKRLLQRRLSGYAIVALLVLSAPLGKLFENVTKVVAGKL